MSGLFLGLFLGALIILGSSFDRLFNVKEPPSIGKPVPDFELNNLDNQAVRLSSLRGKPVVINFWATWCGPCKDELPLFEKYQRSHGDKFTILAVNALEEQQIVKNFVLERKFTFSVALDERGEIVNQYFVRGFPTTFFVDKDGILRGQIIGQLNEDLFRKNLNQIEGLP